MDFMIKSRRPGLNRYPVPGPSPYHWLDDIPSQTNSSYFSKKPPKWARKYLWLGGWHRFVDGCSSDILTPINATFPVGGWTNPFDKYIVQVGSSSPRIGVKIENIWVATNQTFSLTYTFPKQKCMAKWSGRPICSLFLQVTFPIPVRCSLHESGLNSLKSCQVSHIPDSTARCTKQRTLLTQFHRHHPPDKIVAEFTHICNAKTSSAPNAFSVGSHSAHRDPKTHHLSDQRNDEIHLLQFLVIELWLHHNLCSMCPAAMFLPIGTKAHLWGRSTTSGRTADYYTSEN